MLETNKKLLWEEVVNILEDKKTKEIVVIDLEEVSLIADFMIICSGTSNVHIKSISQTLIKEMKNNDDYKIYGTEGLDSRTWVLIDLGEVIVHIMDSEARQFYGLEQLWSNAKKIYPLENDNLTIA